MFKLKNEEELRAMTENERVLYSQAKSENDIAIAVQKANDETNKLLEDVTAQFKKELEASVSKGGADLKTMTDKFELLQTSVENTLKSERTIGKAKSVLGELKKSLREVHNDNYDYKLDGNRIVIKAFDSLDIMTVTDVPSGVLPANGTVSAIGDGYRNILAQNLGILDATRPYSPIMDLISIRPLQSDRLVVFNRTIRGGFDITPECEIKPSVYTSLDTQSKDAVTVAAVFYTDTVIRRFYDRVVSESIAIYRELLTEKIPSIVIAEILAQGVPYTVLPSQVVFTDPNNFDAIVQVVSSMKKQGYVPNGIVLSSIAYGNMITQKDNEKTYMLSNGMSIQIINGSTIKIGSVNLTVTEDPTIDDDAMFIGDFRKSVILGIDGQTIYMETDGITDVSNAIHSTGITRNIRTHVLEKIAVVMIPDAYKSGIVSDTFTNVKTQITI